MLIDTTIIYNKISEMSINNPHFVAVLLKRSAKYPRQQGFVEKADKVGAF